MRLFVAIVLDQASRDRIIAEQRRLVSGLGPAAKSLRIVGPDQLHLTLAFIGEVDDSRGASIAGGFGADFEHPRFTLTLGGAGVYPTRGAARVLWLGLLGGTDEVTALRALVVRRLIESGVDLDQRRFSPHLTLGRWRAGERRVRLAGADRPASFDVRTTDGRRRTAIDERRTDNAERTIARVVVNEVTLFDSRLSASGSTYTAVARARLSCPSLS